ncbi:TIGR03086 family metal-binding protein [Nonomuraea turcica]|uniref:TIGR03086 family metal-binding protein n=1 Tax=Nonomuraea sp. G32 TaxID=3067274 RepID=UPI00273CDE39|nr:TIGR03086 family metal-binding protein [Nonomuraea sp. G32]MDP4503770.1 TIGR03086 family metal-binding protein [Nonomuraea sp. G32]
MDPHTAVESYYHAWQHRAGEMSEVPLADSFSFIGPVASFTDSASYRAMARQAGAAVRDFRVRHQFTDGDLVCSIIDWEMDPLPGTLTAAELLRVHDGRIVSGELIYDAEDLRRVMAGPPAVTGLLERSHALVGHLLGQIGEQDWAAASPCEKWTVRQTANHLAGGLLLLARVAERDQVDPAEFDAQRQADTDHLGADPAAAFAAVTDRSMAAFTAPGALEREYAFMGDTVPGAALASISLIESLVHGWDIATGAHLPYRADDDAVQAVWELATTSPIVTEHRSGRFADPLPVLPTAPLAVRLLAHLGRHTQP